MENERTETGSLLGPDSSFNGKLTFLGTVRIEGCFEGDVLSEGTLVVADGVVRGRVEVGTLVVTGGLVEADIVARSCVELHPPGRLCGTVRTPSFQMEKGAIFVGQSLMPDGPKESEEPA